MDGPEFERIAALPGLAESLLRSVVADLEVVEDSYPHLPVGDVRRSALNKLVNALFPAHLGLLFLREQLFDPAWWVRPGRSLYSPQTMAVTLEEYERSLKFSTLMASFSATESTLRSVATIVQSFGSKPPPFKVVYDALFDAMDVETAVKETVDFYRLLRNSSHSNTVHRGNSQTVPWRGDDYEFADGCTVSFLSWEVLFALVRDVSTITARVLLHDKVRCVRAIEDPYGSCGTA